MIQSHLISGLSVNIERGTGVNMELNILLMLLTKSKLADFISTKTIGKDLVLKVAID